MNADKLEELLTESNFDVQKKNYLVNGFCTGFDLCYCGPQERKDTARNIPLCIGSKEEVWSKMMKETKEGRYAGPYWIIPFDRYVQSPIGLVPKDGGKKTRLIFHLSYDFKESGFGSVNSYIPKEVCSVRYNDIDEVVKFSFCRGELALTSLCFTARQTFPLHSV